MTRNRHFLIGSQQPRPKSKHLCPAQPGVFLLVLTPVPTTRMTDQPRPKGSYRKKRKREKRRGCLVLALANLPIIMHPEPTDPRQQQQQHSKAAQKIPMRRVSARKGRKNQQGGGRAWIPTHQQPASQPLQMPIWPGMQQQRCLFPKHDCTSTPGNWLIFRQPQRTSRSPGPASGRTMGLAPPPFFSFSFRFRNSVCLPYLLTRVTKVPSGQTRDGKNTRPKTSSASTTVGIQCQRQLGWLLLPFCGVADHHGYEMNGGGHGACLYFGGDKMSTKSRMHHGESMDQKIPHARGG